MNLLRYNMLPCPHSHPPRPVLFARSLYHGAPLIALIVFQDGNRPVDPDTISTIIKKVAKKRTRQRQDEQAQIVLKRCPPWDVLLVAICSSTWKTRFLPTPRRVQGWKPNNTPQTCKCGGQFTVKHAMICHMGLEVSQLCVITRFVTSPPNLLLKSTAMLPLSPQSNHLQSMRKYDSSLCKHWWWSLCRCLCKRFLKCIIGWILWCKGVLSEHILQLFCSTDVSSSYGNMNKSIKGNVDNESERLNMTCSPLLLFLQLVAWEGKQQPSKNALQTWLLRRDSIPDPAVMGWLRCRLSSTSLRASIMCTQRSRLSFHHPVYGSDITLATSEGRVFSN